MGTFPCVKTRHCFEARRVSDRQQAADLGMEKSQLFCLRFSKTSLFWSRLMKKRTATTLTLLPDGRVGVRFSYDTDLIARIRALPERDWNPGEKRWEVGIACLPELVRAVRMDMADVDKKIVRAYHIYRIRHVRARITIDNVVSVLSGASLPLPMIDSATSVVVPGYKYMKQFQQGSWDGRRRLFNRRTKRFPSGLVPRVTRILREHAVEYELQLPAEPPKINLDGKLTAPKTKLRPYQQEAFDRALDEKRGIIEIATGGGKTLLAAHIIHHLSRPTVFLVHTKDLLYQTMDTLQRELGIVPGQAGDGRVDPQPVTVATVQTCVRAFDLKLDTCPDGEALPSDEPVAYDKLAMLRNYLKEVNVAIFDECHHLPTDSTYGLANELVNAHWRYGLSATPYRADRMELLMEAALGPKFYSARASSLIEQGYLVPPRIFIKTVPALTVRQFKPEYNEIYSIYVVENRRRNKMIAEMTAEMIGQGKSVLVLVNQVRHGQILEKLMPGVPLLHGNTSTAERQRILDELRSKTGPAVIATTLADEGLDVPTLDCVIVAGAGKSPTRVFQRIGRALRRAPGKKEATIIDFLDDAPFLREHAVDRLELYKTESQFILDT